MHFKKALWQSLTRSENSFTIETLDGLGESLPSRRRGVIADFFPPHLTDS